MEKVGFECVDGAVAGSADVVVSGKVTGDVDAGGDATTSAEKSRKAMFARCVQSLVHACHCCDEECRLPSCHKMKVVIQHVSSCKKKTIQEISRDEAAGCSVCKQFVALCCYHAKQCTEQNCPVYYCANIKLKLR